MGIVKKSMPTEAWLGTKLFVLWMHLANLHAEHEKVAPCSYAGPPLGMKVQKADFRTEEQKEFDELYT